MFLKKSVLFAALVLTGLAGTSRGAEPIAPEQLSKLLQMIKPHPGEAKWAEIPWIADPWEARTKAAKEGRPIFIWSGSADVLGCT